uniref:Uncharacterized protein n=1 Tax=Anguilla anguilla TaxID=7936 RepID=A0A0E9XAP5_ANGAN
MPFGGNEGSSQRSHSTVLISNSWG